MKQQSKPKKKVSMTLPTVVPQTRSKGEPEKTGFPLDHYSYSTFKKFSSNPFMFKVNAINGDVIDTTSNVKGVLGTACHKAMEVYFGGSKKKATSLDEGEAIKEGYETGKEYLDAYSDGFIAWNDDIPNRTKLEERYSFAYFGYVKELRFNAKKQKIMIAEKMLKHRVEISGKLLPVPLKGAADLVYTEASLLKIWDHKFVSKHSGDEKIDGAKLLQAAFNYFLVYAETGIRPYSMTFAEHKIIPNKDKTKPQLKTFTIVYEKVPLMFELFYRFYGDVTDALLGKMVYVPNLDALYDNEVSLLAYIHRLDIDEEKAAQLKKLKVDNITDFLRKKISKETQIKAFMDTTAQKFVSSITLNYSKMTTEEKIKFKLAEHGIGVEFDSKIVGSSVTLYRYEPSIGVKMSRIEKFAKDIELVTASTGVRVLAPISGTDLIGFEVPNKARTFLGAAPRAMNLRVAVGVDIQGNTQYIDINEAPHILIAGSTGSGKSVLLNSMLTSIGKSAELWLMDPKQVELEDIPHTHYADTPEEIEALLAKLLGIMDKRYAEMKQGKQKTYSGHRIIAVIDEFGDLMLARGKGAINKAGLENTIVRLGQKARAAGIHLIIATQRPSVDVVTGLIKANFPTRIALKTASPKDSEVILGQAGAEKLCGKGDMLLVRSTEPETVRIQGYSS